MLTDFLNDDAQVANRAAITERVGWAAVMSRAFKYDERHVLHILELQLIISNGRSC